VLPRRHTLARRDPGERNVEQVMVANVDIVAIVHGLDRRLPPGRLERLLIMAWDSGAEPIIVLTKSDLDDLYDARGIARALGGATSIVDVSRVDGRGVLELRRRIPLGATAALVGESGAGKSNLVNLLVGEAVQATGRVRQRDAKGRHTTVAREIHVIPGGGAVVDTPGIRAVGLLASEDTLHRVFADIDELADDCRFADCGHDSEPQCAVRQAVVDGRLDQRRLLRYRALAAEIARTAVVPLEQTPPPLTAHPQTPFLWCSIRVDTYRTPTERDVEVSCRRWPVRVRPVCGGRACGSR
jgi:ribosome biogenesis GTPase